jgi:hypothetical protein
VARPRKPSTEAKDASRSTAERASVLKSGFESEHPRAHAESGQQFEVVSEHPASDFESGQQPQSDAERPRRRGRHVPAAVRRTVFERDEARCTYVDALGRRCAETRRLELHHLRAFALGGEHTEHNLTLRCNAHNALAAEQDFGRDFIELAQGASEHEPWAAQPDT